MADVMSCNSGHFGWCDLEKFRKRWKHNKIIQSIECVFDVQYLIKAYNYICWRLTQYLRIKKMSV